MAKQIEFEGEVHEFPDDFTDDEIAAALEASAPQSTASGPFIGGREAQGAYGMEPDQGTPKSNLFPSASQMSNSQPANETIAALSANFQPGQILSGGSNAPARAAVGALDLMGAPTRGAAAALTDQKMSDSDAYALKPLVQSANETIAALSKNYQPGQILSGGSDLPARFASDPFSYAGLIAKSLSYIPSLFRGAGAAAGGVNKVAGWTAAKASGVPEEALRAAGSPYGRARMAKNFGQERAIGESLLTRIDNADDYIPERAVVDAGLEKMAPMDLTPAIQSLEGGKGAAVAGRVAPHKAVANEAIDRYVQFLRGGDLPPDLAQAAQEAGRAAQAAKGAAVTKGAEAGTEAKAAVQAERQAASAQQKAGKAAAGVGKARKDADGVLHAWDREDAANAIQASIKEARDAAAKSREAAINARARVAVGEVTEQEAKAAEAAAEAADRGADAAEVAARFRGGEKLVSISQDLAARGLPRDALRNALKSGKARAESIKELPPQTVSAKEYRDLRRDLDVPIDWDAEGAQIKNAALKSGRTTMKNELLKAAEASGDPAYAEAMRSWSGKLDKLERIKDLLGKTGTARDKRVEQFISNLFGRNNKYKTELMADIDKIFGGNTVSRAKAADMAKKFGETGKPGILPAWGTGGSVSMGVNSALVLPRAAAAVATLGTASPLIASRFTLPMLTKLEQGLKGAGVALTPKSQFVLKAMKKPISDTQRARLASILAAELEAQLPTNTIPFRMKDAASVEEDPQYTQR